MLTHNNIALFYFCYCGSSKHHEAHPVANVADETEK